MKTKMIVHLNCWPLEKDGGTQIVKSSDYASFTIYGDTLAFENTDTLLNELLDAGVIHSFLIQRDGLLHYKSFA